MLYFLIFTTIVLAGQFIYRIVRNESNSSPTKPSPYAFVDSSFGKIDYPEIPSLTISEAANPSFSVNGQFVDFPTSVNVYQVDKPRETLGNRVKAEDLASSLGFLSSAVSEGEYYKWATNEKALEYNKLNKNFEYKNTEIINSNTDRAEISDIEEVSNTINRILQITKQPTRFTSENLNYINYISQGYTKVSSASQANFILSDFYESYEIVSLKSSIQTDPAQNTSNASKLDGRIYFTDPLLGSTRIIITNEDYKKDRNAKEIDFLAEIKTISSNIDLDSTAVYPLKDIEEAWEDIKDGKGSLRSLVKKSENPYSNYRELTVNRFIADPSQTKLGFYYPEEWTGYIYPIYIFSGSAELSDNTSADFVFYTKAIEQ